ncbi:MAG: hypothetical protein GTN78_13610 [Gemmatimonadales bacterium]|nr:hypothetical protein [Gemmatimonadales bacterium]NIR01214.1 hypothetical protein [Gemmatimonadales bacterium]NIS65237.1 hypothetical protein [Gemmatimonadales bacterium]
MRLSAIAALVLALCASASPAAGQDILQAVERGDAAAVRQLLDQDPARVQLADEDGRTLLHAAAARGHVAVVRLLTEHGADVEAGDYEEHTPLHLAALRSRAGVVRALAEAGADLEARDDHGRTALLLVARETGNRDMAALLLELGADVNARDRSGDSPLSLAAWRGFRGLVDLFLDEGAHAPTSSGAVQELMGYATGKGLDRLFRLLLDQGADLTVRNVNGGTLLHSACEGGSVAIADMLLERGLDINEQDRYGRTPLHYAAERGRTEVAQRLLRAGADLNVRTLSGSTPLNVAQARGRDETAQLLASAGADTSPPRFPALTGPYLGQPAPGNEPALFAPDIVASHRFEHCVVTFSPDADEAFWGSSFQPADSGYTRGIILTSRLQDGRWTPPRPASFSSNLRYGEGEPFFSPAGDRVYFISQRPHPVDGSRRERVWFADRADTGWSAAQVIEGGPNARDLHWQFSVAANGNIYTGSRGDILVSRYHNGQWAEPERLGDAVNSEEGEGSPFIAPDESYLIFMRSGGPGLRQYVSFRDGAGRWTTPRDLGDAVNAAGSVCAAVSPDGKYLFFHSFGNGNADIYWVDAAVVHELRNR